MDRKRDAYDRVHVMAALGLAEHNLRNLARSVEDLAAAIERNTGLDAALARAGRTPSQLVQQVVCWTELLEAIERLEQRGMRDDA